LTNFNDMPPDSRVWVYQSSPKLSEPEMISVMKKANLFIEEWTAHGTKLKACFEIRHGIFLVMLVDEKQAMASGCSIDTFLHFILLLESDIGVSLTNRMLFAYRNNDGEISVADRIEFERLAKTETITGETKVFNTLVKNKSELESGFEIPFEKSWHKNLISV